MISFELLLFIFIISIIIYEIIKFHIDNIFNEWKYKPYKLKILYSSKSNYSLKLLKEFNLNVKSIITNDPIYEKIGLIFFDRDTNRVRSILEHLYDYIINIFESPKIYCNCKLNNYIAYDDFLSIVLEKPQRSYITYSKYIQEYESIIFIDYMTSYNVLDFIRQNLNS